MQQCKCYAQCISSDPNVFVDGVRTPFLASLTDFESMMPNELLSQAFTGLLSRTGVSPAQVDYLCLGTVQQEVRTSNITKEAAFDAGFPLYIPGYTVTMACIFLQTRLSPPAWVSLPLARLRSVFQVG